MAKSDIPDLNRREVNPPVPACDDVTSDIGQVNRRLEVVDSELFVVVNNSEVDLEIFPNVF